MIASRVPNFEKFSKIFKCWRFFVPKNKLGDWIVISILLLFDDLDDITFDCFPFSRVDRQNDGGGEISEKPRCHCLNCVSVVWIVEEEFDEQFFAARKAVEKDEKRPVQEPRPLLQQLQRARRAIATRRLVDIFAQLSPSGYTQQR